METELTPSVPPVVTPSEETKTEPAEVEETPAAEPVAVVAPERFQMPDGRMLTGAEVKAEYEKLLPDYTQKSQKLAELTRTAPVENLPEWKREGYVPKSYAEIIEIAEKQALDRISSEAAAAEKQRAEVNTLIESQLAAIKSKDPKLNEEALFTHATKYGFRDLNLAYQNMSEMKTVARVTEERVIQGQKKKVDPIATGTGAGAGSATIRYAPATSATDFLARLKK